MSRINRGRRTMTRIYRGSVAVCLSCPAFGVCTKSKRWPHPEDRPPGRALRRHRASTRSQTGVQTEKATGRTGLRDHQREQLQARSFLLRGLNNVAAEWSLLVQPSTCAPRIWRTQAPDPEFERNAESGRPRRSGQVSTDKRRGISYMCDPGDRCRNDGVSNPPAHTNDAETPGHEPRTLIRQAPGYGVTFLRRKTVWGVPVLSEVPAGSGMTGVWWGSGCRRHTGVDTWGVGDDGCVVGFPRFTNDVEPLPRTGGDV